MLIDLVEILKIAEEKKLGFGAFGGLTLLEICERYSCWFML